MQRSIRLRHVCIIGLLAWCAWLSLASSSLRLSALSVVDGARTHFDPSAPPPNPNPPAPEFVKARNARRFPGEFFPEGYDVGEPATSGTASSHVSWMSPRGYEVANEPRIWFDPAHPEYRPAGTLLLNMLVMNEAIHLERTLPAWAKVIDYWIIGVDEKNTDDSERIIKKYLGHLPGMIAEVRGFDGHGPTWTTLVDLGIKHFPGATHGIIADADFRPMQETLDRMALDIRCSKHMFTVWASDHRNERRMDWVYRNIPGAKISRRTHQVVEVPVQPDQEVFQTLLPFAVDEQPGGYGDRSGGKEERYIKWMAADLLDFPDDPRALYYLGYGHLDLFHSTSPSDPRHNDALDKSIHYFTRRVELPQSVGNKEERWFATLKLAEIYERYRNDWPKAEHYYQSCIAQDGERADPFFYLGQHYRLVNNPQRAEPLLYTAATMAQPQRSLFMWHYLYQCLSRLEYARNWLLLDSPTGGKGASIKATKRALRVLDAANCVEGDPGNLEERDTLREQVRQALNQKRARRDKKKAKMERLRKEKASERQQQTVEAADEPSVVGESEATSDAATAASASIDAVLDRIPRPLSLAATLAAMSTDELRAHIDEERDKLDTAREFLRTLLHLTDALDAPVKRQAGTKPTIDANAAAGVDLYAALVRSASDLSGYLDAYAALSSASSEVALHQRAEYLTCRRYRLATMPILQLARDKSQLIATLASDRRSTLAEWAASVDSARTLCR